MDIPRMAEQDQSFDLVLPQNIQYTPCGKGHTYHPEDWPATGTIAISKCERQCRFRACKAWSQTAAALRKHVNAHILNNNLNLRVIPATNGREPVRIIPGHDTVLHVGAPQAQTSSSGSTPFSSFETSSTTGTPSDASSKSSLQRLNEDVDDFNWDLPKHRPDWGAIVRKRPSSSSSSLISVKRANTGSSVDNLSASSSKVTRPSIDDLVNQAMAESTELELSQTPSKTGRPDHSVIGHVGPGPPPAIIEDAYVHRIDSLMAKVQRLREASTQASLKAPFKDRSPFRQGSPLAPSRTRSQQPPESRNGIGSYTREYHNPVEEYRDKESNDKRSNSSEQRVNTTISPKMISLEFHEDDGLSSVINNPHQQFDPRTPGGYEYFGAVDFMGPSASISPQNYQAQSLGSSERQRMSSTRETYSAPFAHISATANYTSNLSHSPRAENFSRLTMGTRNASLITENPPYSSVNVPKDGDNSSAESYRLGNKQPRAMKRQRQHVAPPDDEEELIRRDRLQCRVCQKFVKTQSELRKHNLRHTRPFRCGLPGCDLKDGLCTSNDLARHIKSRHPSCAPSDIVRRYRCHFPGCKSKEKTWARLDNFRSHLKRVHSYHLTEIGIDNVVHGAQFDDAATESEAMVTSKPLLPRPVQNVFDNLDLQSLHVLADSAVQSHLYDQWSQKDEGAKSATSPA